MKRFLCVFLVILILFSTAGTRCTYATHTTGNLGVEVYSLLGNALSGSMKSFNNDVLKEELKSKFGYEGEIVSPMQIRTKITLSSGKDKNSANQYTKYKVKIGNNENGVEMYRNGKSDTEFTLSTQEIKEIFACPDNITFENKEYTYDVILRATTPKSLTIKSTSVDTSGATLVESAYILSVTDIWSGADMNNLGDAFDNQQEVNVGEVEPGDGGIAQGVSQGISGSFDFISNFMHNPLGTIATLFLDLLRVALGEWVQILANMVQTISIGTADDLELVYDREDIEKNQELNNYVNVTDYEEDGGKDWQIIKNISGAEYGFDSDTKIPVIPADVYNMAIGNIDLLDVNFLVVNRNNHPQGSPWLAIRNFFTALIHIAIYIAAGFLIGTLIFHGIMIVISSYRTPEEVRRHREGIVRFIQSLGMLFGTILIMAVFIYVSDFLLSDNMQADSNELPIRVNVEGAYSFSTNITGYVRYRAQIENVDLSVRKAGWTAAFIIFSWLNLVAVIVLIIRMIAMMILAVVGIVISIENVVSVNFEGNIPRLGYRGWIELYAVFAAVQLVLAIISNIILETLN